MKRSERLLAITEMLRASGERGRSTTWLARELDVSTRTIKRDMAALHAAGVPLVATEGRGGGYTILSRSALAPVPLTAGEAAAVVVALGAEPLMPFAADGRAAAAKLLAAMTDEQRAHTQDIASRVWMRRDPANRRDASAAIVDEALRTMTCVRIHYADGSGARTTRTVEPMAFARTGGHWYLLAWCHERRDGRWFRLDRISRAWPTHLPIVPRALDDVFGAPPDDALPASISSHLA